MKAYILRTEKKLDPFNEHPGGCLIGNKTLEKLRRKILLGLSLEIVVVSDVSQIDDKQEYIFLHDSLYFTEELLSEFIAKSRKQKSVTTCALKSGITTLRTATSVQEVKRYPDRVEYNLHYSPEKKYRGGYSYVVIEPDQFSTSVPMPEHMCGSEEYVIPMTEKFIVQVDHWVNLWVVNIMIILAEGARLRRASKRKLFVLAVKAFSLNKWKILERINRIGRGCDIHPTAYIEGSIVGNDVKIGAGTIIRESVIGDNVFIGNGVVVEESVIGEKSTILNGHILYSVFYPGVFSVTEMVSASLIGRNSFIGSKATLTDFRFDGENVMVLKDGVKIDTGNKFLGSCLGHGVYLGSGCVVAPGRMIPQGLHIAPEKNRIITDSGYESYRLIGEKSITSK
ncbi:MAG: hypothetical protein PHI53_03810 [Candidatus Pacebacteria bacterium]|nr:hypothetical protein [Candidatus Paceibacterota bacterium]